MFVSYSTINVSTVKVSAGILLHKLRWWVDADAHAEETLELQAALYIYMLEVSWLFPAVNAVACPQVTIK
jgi:hypothetical protein